MVYNKKHIFHRLIVLTMGVALCGAPGYAMESVHGETEGVQGTESSNVFTLKEMVVTGYHANMPLTVSTNPQEPRQPVPAADGGGYLKSIPGFSVVRKSGIAGDPMLRGMGSGRLVICTNCSKMSGACPGRMDSTASYVFPETYSRIIVNKGPQSVRYGASVAGSVIFERRTPRFKKAGERGQLSVLVGSNHRFDELADISTGNENGYIRIIQMRNYSQNYKDGDGNIIHSGYGRDAQAFIAGYTPNENTLFELSYDRGRGWAKFASGGMDGVQFDRDSLTFKFEKKYKASHVKKVSVNFNYDDINHIMDGYSLRGKSDGMSMNPIRKQYNLGAIWDLRFSKNETGAVGFDYSKQQHTHAMKMMGEEYDSPERDMTIYQFGVFGEYNRTLAPGEKFLTGIRWDDTRSNYEKRYSRLPGSIKTYAFSGFLRYEKNNKNQPLTFYVGLGHAERAADYWESFNSWTASSKWSAPYRDVKPEESQPKKERNTELDFGWIYNDRRTNAGISFYYAQVKDFILYSPKVVEGWKHYINVDAGLYGMEAEIRHKVTSHLTLGASLSWTHGDDLTNHAPLPQIAPLEGKLTAKYKIGKSETNIVWRMVDAQNRYHEGYGTVVGTDSGPSVGFGILSLSFSYKPMKNMSLSFGIDNIFNKTYSEFVNKKQVPNALVGAGGNNHIHEPGRTFWMRSNYRF